ncbi:hypothetical protein BDB01DRAFT_811436 [Pilobolus umbonatus]|nr:hypothetical protein BDB01DRAFT_811436 [Pilobolus umbonatus]
MEYLPYEIIESIVHLLVSKDFFQCITVNKFWYTLFIKYLYTSIEFKNEHRINLFLNSLQLYSRSMDAGSYVRHLDLSTLKSENIVHATNGSHILSALVYCPNIEQLTLYPKPYIIESILDTNMPDMNRLKKIIFTSVYYHSKMNNRIMECYYKYRLSITCLLLDKMVNILSERTPNSLILYLTSFSRLERLNIALPLISNTSMFHTILTQCPQLTSLQYKCERIVVPTDGEPFICKYPLMRDLILNVNAFCLDDAHYIERRFIRLKCLKIYIKNKLHNEVDVVQALGTINTLDYFTIKVFHPLHVSTLDVFWKQAVISPAQNQTTNKAAFLQNMYDTPSTRLSFVRCPMTGIKRTSSEIIIREDIGSQYETYLESMGAYLAELETRDLNFPSVVNLEVINRLCPQLFNLLITSSRITIPNHLIKPSKHLTTLTLSYCKMSNESFRDIELAYPGLLKLKLAPAIFEVNHVTDQIHGFQLPETGLETLIYEKCMFSYSKMNVIIVREIEGIPARSWYYNQQSKQLEVSENEDIVSQMKRLSVTPLILLRSSTLQDVQVVIY